MFAKPEFNQLIINNLGFVDWNNSSANNFKNNDVVSVWKIEMASFLSHLEILKNLLQPAELQKAMRYQHENDQNQRIISKAVLRILLSNFTGIEAREIVFVADENKKPVIQNSVSEPIHFNAAHSGNYVLISISQNPTGIDVEKLDTSFTYQNLLEYSFSNSEADFIANSAFPQQTFYELWTRKEALLKATGKGLDDDLAKIPCLNGLHQIQNALIKSNQNWQISSFQVDENHVGSVAFAPIKTALQFINFQL